jgi:hypothetical protein
MIRHFPLTILLVVWSLSGCLTVENKEYHITLTTDHSGEATIKFLDIVSETDDTIDISDDDFQQLIEFYLEGTQLEAENPGFRNVRKQLYEEDGMLVGEVTFDFDSLSVVRLFKFDEDSPFMYFVGSPFSSELLVETNGSFGQDWMPVVFWEKDTRELYVKTKVASEVVHHRSLLKNFKEWQELKSRGEIKKPKPPKK